MRLLKKRKMLDERRVVEDQTQNNIDMEQKYSELLP